MRNLPTAIGDPLASAALGSKTEEAALACHQWQHGPHIDSLPRAPHTEQEQRRQTYKEIDRRLDVIINRGQRALELRELLKRAIETTDRLDAEIHGRIKDLNMQMRKV
jgi:hypothetical protein